MTNVTKRLVLAAAVALVASGTALADDNSMSPFTGESYAAFNGSTINTPNPERANPVAEGDKAVASAKRHARLPREYDNPFRDDTAA